MEQALDLIIQHAESAVSNVTRQYDVLVAGDIPGKNTP